MVADGCQPHESLRDDEPLAAAEGRPVDAINAGRVWVQNQTIYVNGEPRSIQTLPREVLEAVSRSLYRASRRHENLAACALVIPLVGWFVLFCCLRVALHMEAANTLGPNLALAAISGVIPLVVWCSVYDVRRRHRCALRVVESRWAELQAEIAVRDADRT